ncbi:pentatricopeptide repeat-containing protein, chloroplastic [Quillaja saponaria]|uniref:Pentatricopeptide repeat-containing protein, chloroplastic n=1 Tax=Quillaja saponaria TaxID=32244 RepID=A0AAD7LKS7_QUISA|nr:pentatricopeptide repeat-containing protein, chloroplastic [Quillaja saponaria]
MLDEEVDRMKNMKRKPDGARGGALSKRICRSWQMGWGSKNKNQVHPQAKSIYKTLDEVDKLLEMNRFKFKLTSEMLYDMDEEWKPGRNSRRGAESTEGEVGHCF